jgi:CRISPR-associated endonuclease/helicase Cas3
MTASTGRPNFKTFFQHATKCWPFPFQERLAEASTLPEVLQVPTGTGKTAAAVLAWLWRRQNRPAETPRRLVYCLPMRVLVQQTRACAVLWLHRLGLLAGKVDNDEAGRVVRYEPSWSEPERIAVATLMGGETGDEWREYPEREVILVGTQDMLISRALNRGYAARPPAWPVEFGLLNVDTLWVMDEVQLMGPARTTSVQLQLFSTDRATADRDDHWPPRHTLWMSATLGAKPGSIDPPSWMKTPEWGSRKLISPVEGAREEGSKQDCDLTHEEFADRWRAPKKLELYIRSADIAVPKAPRRGSKKTTEQVATDSSWVFDSPTLIQRVLQEATSEQHRSVLVFVNRVDRARSLFNAIKPQVANVEPLLLHSRFRPKDRRKTEERLLQPAPPQGRIIVSTQVLEAGVDLDAQVIFTEVCPWPSLVQRLGRLNRRGLQKASPAPAIVFDVPLPARKDNESESEYRERARKESSPPYDADELDVTRERVRNLEENGGNVSPEALSRIDSPVSISGPVLRRFDLEDFFDTDPDLAGGYTDVSPYVRALDRDVDAYVLWRRLELNPDDQPPIHPDELCPVPFYEVRRAFTRVWILTLATGKRRGSAWRRSLSSDVQAGDTVMVAVSDGCYNEEAGWLGQGCSKERPGRWVDRWDRSDGTAARAWARRDGSAKTTFAEAEIIDLHVDAQLASGEDPRSFTKCWMELDHHLREAERHAQAIVNAISLPNHERQAVQTAARWHDVGKALEREDNGDLRRPFQAMLWNAGHEENGEPRPNVLYAKSNGSGGRSGFRHEVASALAYLSRPDADNLVAYLVISHHGKVRLLPTPWDDDDPVDANGVYLVDRIPCLAIPNATNVEPIRLDPTCFLPSRRHPGWQGRVGLLLDRLGPFRLAFLEALVRVADWRAS